MKELVHIFESFDRNYTEALKSGQFDRMHEISSAVRLIYYELRPSEKQQIENSFPWWGIALNFEN